MAVIGSLRKEQQDVVEVPDHALQFQSLIFSQVVLRVHEKMQIEDGLGCSIDKELLYLAVLSYFVDH